MNTKYHLEELKGSDYKIIDEEPDILGWIIRDSAGLKVGKVRDLLFDTESLMVRYIICELKDNELNLQEREVLLPMGRVILDQQNETVLLNRMHNLYFQNAPAYTYDALNAEYETTLHGFYQDENQLPIVYDRNTFYENDYFKNDYYRSRKL